MDFVCVAGSHLHCVQMSPGHWSILIQLALPQKCGGFPSFSSGAKQHVHFILTIHGKTAVLLLMENKVQALSC